MNLLDYKDFYRKRGVRYPAHLTKPPVSSFSSLVLPKNSAIHFPQYDEDHESVDVNATGFDINQNYHLFKHIKKDMFAQVISEFDSEPLLGGPIAKNINLTPIIGKYYRTNRRIKRLGEGRVVTDMTTMTFYLYGLMNTRYRYPVPKRDTQLNNWLNYWDTVFGNLSKAVLEDNRQHFIIIDAPVMIPPLPVLLKFENFDLDIKNVRYMATPDAWMTMSFWKLLSNNQKSPAFIFKNLSKEAWSRITLLFKYKDMCTFVNLDKLLNFSKGHNEKGVYERLRMNKFMLNFYMVLKESAPEELVVEDTVLEEGEEAEGGEETNDDLKERMKTSQQRLNELFPDNVAQMTAKAMAVTKAESSKGREDDTEKDSTEVEIEELESEVDGKLEMLESISEVDASDENFDTAAMVYSDYSKKTLTTEYSEDSIKVAEHLAKVGTLTAGELRHANKLANAYKNIKDPRGGDKPFTALLDVSKENINLAEDKTIAREDVVAVLADKSMAESTLKNFDKKYINEVMPKHIAKTVMAINKLGVTIQGYEVERVRTVTDDFENHTVRITTVAGKSSTLHFRMPVVNEEGSFKMNGVSSRMRKQWSDLPIRKIDEQVVALTSYYSKLFVRRTERAAFNYEKWLMGNFVSQAIDTNYPNVTDAKLNNVFNNYYNLPREYTMMAKRLSSFKTKGYTFFWDYDKRAEFFGSIPRTFMFTPVAISQDGKKTINMVLKGDDAGMLELPDKTMISLEEFLEIDLEKAPEDYVELDVYGKSIPMVLILGYQLGLGNLLATLKVNYLRQAKVTDELYKTHLIVRFRDEYILIPKRDKVACLIMNGFNRFKNDIRKRSVYDFDNKDAYADVFENNSIDLRYLKECQTMFPMWVDHITHDVLVEMGEPTDLVLLLLRATELLMTDYHPDSMDTSQMRLKGYERFSGLLYSEIVRASRDYNLKPNRKDKAFTMHPDAVWYAIAKDETVILTEQSNPIHYLKEQEITVYRGQGGRSSRSMVADARKYHKKGMGVISEATVDSKDVGTVVYLSSNPTFENLYGMIPKDNWREKPTPSQTISTSMLLAPGADIDDPKRTGFTAVQNSQTMPAAGYRLLPVRTGYERVIAGRTGEGFCKLAELDGVVTDIDDTVINVAYSDGSTGAYNIGTTYAPWGGKTVCHTTLTDLSKGDKFKNGDVLTYNSSFFKKDKLIPNQVSLVTQSLGRIALIEGGDVYEDSCAISATFAQSLSANTAHIRNISLDAKQDITNLLTVGTEVWPDTILCTILNTQTDSSFYDADTLQLLEKLGSTTPKAKYRGRVTEIRALYTGEVENMSDGVKDVVLMCDKKIYRRSKKRGEPVKNGRVDVGFRVDGNPMAKDSVVIQVYITEDLGMGVGDKLVVGNQLKGTVARVWTDDNTDADGNPVDGYFSGHSVDKRIVNSPFLVGTTNTLMLHITDLVTKYYFSSPEGNK